MASPEEAARGVMVGVPTHGGRYMLYEILGVAFEIPVKYVPPIVPLGRGSSGLVCSAENSETGEKVAIKKVFDPFQDQIDAKRTLREIILLRHLKHPEVIGLKDLILPPSAEEMHDIYIVYELMPLDLKEVIVLRALNSRHHKMIMYRLLRGLKYIHSANILHRDLKPENILVDNKCRVKITDFGLARTKAVADQDMTEYVVTRWYRAPELLLSCTDYTAAIDIWSVGCMFVEMVTGQVLLQGQHYIDQLSKTCQLTGSPTKDDLEFLTDEIAKVNMLRLPKWPRQPLSRLVPDPDACDLVQRMLMFDPRKRITVDDALRHPYLSEYHDPMDEPVHTSPLDQDVNFDEDVYTIPRLRELILLQITEFNNLPPYPPQQ